MDARDGQHEHGDGRPGHFHLPGKFWADVLSDGFTLTAGKGQNFDWSKKLHGFAFRC
jgi:hypothetical protein